MTRGVPVLAVAIGVFAMAFPAPSATPPKRYYELAVDAQFYLAVDYGTDPAQLVIGQYQYFGGYQLRAVVIFENRNLRIPEQGAVVGARVAVNDRRKKLDARDPERMRRVPLCPGWDEANDVKVRESGRNRATYRPARQAGVSIGGGVLKIAPALPIKWKLGCAEVDSLERHLLQAGPDAKVRAPTYARFRAGKASSLLCVDRASHGASHPHAVDYQGEVAIRVRFKPIAEDRLSARLEALRGFVDRPSTSSLDPSGNKGGTCL